MTYFGAIALVTMVCMWFLVPGRDVLWTNCLMIWVILPITSRVIPEKSVPFPCALGSEGILCEREGCVSQWSFSLVRAVEARGDLVVVRLGDGMTLELRPSGSAEEMAGWIRERSPELHDDGLRKLQLALAALYVALCPAALTLVAYLSSP